MREGWKSKRLGEVCDIYQPKTISKKDMLDDGPYPVFGANGIIGRYSDYNHEESQLLITCRGATCGTVNMSLPKSWITGNAMVIRPKEPEIDIRYLEYFCRGGMDFSAVITGAAQPQITRQSLAPQLVRYPPLPEQKRIVAILDEAFAGIATAVANTEKNLANARELFESYLNTVFSQSREGWKKQSLSDLCDITSSLVDPREQEYFDLPHIGAGNIISFIGDLIDIQTARDEGLKSGKFVFDSTMVLYSKIRPYLMKVARPEFEGLCSADIYPLKPNSDVLDRDFLYYMLLSKDFTEYAIRGSARTGMPKVNRNHLFAYRVMSPSIEEQKKVAEKLDSIALEARRLESIYKQKHSALGKR